MNLFTILMAILVILNPNKIKLYTKIIINYICKIRIFKFTNMFLTKGWRESAILFNFFLKY